MMQTVVRQPTQTTTTAGCRATEIISSVSTRPALAGRDPRHDHIHALILLSHGPLGGPYAAARCMSRSWYVSFLMTCSAVDDLV